MRRILGVLAVTKRYGPAIADAAAQAALDLQVPLPRRTHPSAGRERTMIVP